MSLFYNDIYKDINGFLKTQKKIQGLFIGVENDVNYELKDSAIKKDQLYIHSNWFQGLLTNLVLLKQQAKKKSNLRGMAIKNGLLSLEKKMPAYIFFINLKHEKNAFHEAMLKKMLIFSISNNRVCSEMDLRNIAYLIPGNINSPSKALQFIHSLKPCYSPTKHIFF